MASDPRVFISHISLRFNNCPADSDCDSDEDEEGIVADSQRTLKELELPSLLNERPVLHQQIAHTLFSSVYHGSWKGKEVVVKVRIEGT